ncbi:MAG TPA: protein kinase, partial [Bryobacteraceae bacterium]|nr:protein kinase [Bryobacteraceae bacterium]
GNIKIKPDGTVKVLDFGLAKVNAGTSASGENSPTLTMGMTQAGMILGTASYMAPEQARGKENVDKRADIWAFGVVLYELITGKRLFHGEDVGDTLASVIKEQPNLDDVPAQVRPLLKRCLEKDPKKRLRDIGDMELLLSRDSNGAGSSAPTPAPLLSRLGKIAMAAAAVFALAAAALAFVHFRETPPPEPTLRSSVSLPENSTVHSFAISPDGRILVIAAAVNGKRQLWLRPMDALQAQPMPFTEDATYPFWSPDNRFIAFFAQGKLKKIAASGGPAQSLCDVPFGLGGSWNRDDVIVFSPDVAGISIQRVPAAGGVPADVTKTKGVQQHPVFLPDGHHFLYLSVSSGIEQTGIYVSSLDGKENRRVMPDASSAVFAPSTHSGRTGHILFVRENTLMAAPFDAPSTQVSGDVFPVAEGVSLTQPVNYVPVTASENGALFYQTGGGIERNQFEWFDRSGKSLGPVGAPGNVGDPAISPDEKSVVFRRKPASGSDLWLRDLSRGTETRLTRDASNNAAPFWSPKGDRIVFASNRKGGVFKLYLRRTSRLRKKSDSGVTSKQRASSSVYARR